MIEVTIIGMFDDSGTFGGRFWLVAAKATDYAERDVNLYLTDVSFYEVVSNPGGEDEITVGAVIRVQPEDLDSPIRYEDLPDHLRPYPES
jgi:hypothetical protein